MNPLDALSELYAVVRTVDATADEHDRYRRYVEAIAKVLNTPIKESETPNA